MDPRFGVLLIIRQRSFGWPVVSDVVSSRRPPACKDESRVNWSRLATRRRAFMRSHTDPHSVGVTRRYSRSDQNLTTAPSHFERHDVYGTSQCSLGWSGWLFKRFGHG